MQDFPSGDGVDQAGNEWKQWVTHIGWGIGNTHVRNEVTAKCDKIPFRIRKLDGEITIIASCADNGTRSPDLSDEIIWLYSRGQNSQESEKTKRRLTSPSGTSRNSKPMNRGSVKWIYARSGCNSLRRLTRYVYWGIGSLRRDSIMTAQIKDLGKISGKHN